MAKPAGLAETCIPATLEAAASDRPLHAGPEAPPFSSWRP